jgi:flagellar biosynthesis/type III secretory pathway protein FliH
MPSPLDLVLPIRIQRIEKLAAAADGDPALGSSSHRAGFDAGYEQGRLRAKWEADREREKQTARVRAMVAKLETLHADYGKLLEEHLPDLIHGALSRVFRQHPFTAAEIGAEITALLAEMEQAGRLTLECAPAAEDDLRRELEDCDAIPTGLRWTLQGNPALNPGEFLLKSDLGDVDGRHSTRLRQIHHALEGRA